MKKSVLYLIFMLTILLLVACSENDTTTDIQSTEGERSSESDPNVTIDNEETTTAIVQEDNTNNELSELEKEVQSFLDEYFEVITKYNSAVTFDRDNVEKYFDMRADYVFKRDREEFLEDEEQRFSKKDGVFRNDHYSERTVEVVEITNEAATTEYGIPFMEVLANSKQVFYYYDENGQLEKEKTRTRENQMLIYVAKADNKFGFLLESFTDLY